MRAIRPDLGRGSWSLWFPLSSTLLISASLELENSVIGLIVLVGSTNIHHTYVQVFVLGVYVRGVQLEGLGEQHCGQR